MSENQVQTTRIILGLIALLAGGRVAWELLLGPRATLNDVTQRVFQDWQMADLQEVSTEHFFRRPDRTSSERYTITIDQDNLQELLQLYAQQLGKLKHYEVVEEKIHRNRKLNLRGNVYASYKLNAEFEKAPATIRLYLDLYGNWKLHHFIIQSPGLSPCLSQVDWQLCSANQAKRNTPEVVQVLLGKIQTLRQCVDCDLSYLNFQQIDLSGVNFTRANLTGVNFDKANLKHANLQGSRLQRARFKSANLEGTNFKDAIGAGVLFHQANLKNANLAQAELPRSWFQQANLQGANLDRSNLEESNFYQADLHHAQLNQTSLFRADFRQARMTRTQMNGANLQCASLGGAEAMRVQINGALMDGTVLPNQAINLPVTLARRKDVALRCSG